MAKSYRFDPKAISIEAGDDRHLDERRQLHPHGPGRRAGRPQGRARRAGLDRLRRARYLPLRLHAPQQGHGRRGDRRVIRPAFLALTLLIALFCALIALAVDQRPRHPRSDHEPRAPPAHAPGRARRVVRDQEPSVDRRGRWNRSVQAAVAPPAQLLDEESRRWLDELRAEEPTRQAADRSPARSARRRGAVRGRAAAAGSAASPRRRARRHRAGSRGRRADERPPAPRRLSRSQPLHDLGLQVRAARGCREAAQARVAGPRDPARARELEPVLEHRSGTGRRGGAERAAGDPPAGDRARS